MPFNQNTAAGTVVYSPGEFFSGKVVANDYIIDSADTGGNLPSGGSDGATYRTPLSVSLGKYERLVFRVWLDFVIDADCDLKYKITTPSGASAFRGVSHISALPAAGGTDALTTAFETTATGVAEATLTGSSDGTVLYAIDGSVVNGATAGDLAIQIAQNTSHASDLVLKAGSYIEYMKF